MRQARERSAQALRSHYPPGETGKDLMSNLFPERKAAFLEDNGAALVGDNPALKKSLAFEDISLHRHGAIKTFTFLPAKSNTSQNKLKLGLKRPSVTQSTILFWLHLSCWLALYQSLIKHGHESFFGL